MVAALVFFSGNNYAKVKLFLDILSIKFISYILSSQMQHLCFAPVIKDSWEKMQQKILEILKDFLELCLCGNGHNGSMGYSGK